MRSPFEAHREYLKNKTNIYLEALPPGTHTFVIRLEPRFEGTYTLNPARMESMYFPTLSGRNRITRIPIQ